MILECLFHVLLPVANAKARPLRQSTAILNSAVNGLKDTGKSTNCPPKPVAPPAPKFPGVYPTEKIKAANGETIEVSVIPRRELKDLYDETKYGESSLDLPWANTCVCYARAHVLGYNLEKLGIQVGKLIAKPAREMWGLAQGSFRPKFQTGRRPYWKFHAAAFVLVQEEDGRREMAVLDPTMFPAAAPTRAAWEEKLGGEGQTHVTNKYALDPDDIYRTDLKAYSTDQKDRRFYSNLTTLMQNETSNPDCHR